MADPLSITTGVVALLSTCIKTGAAVKDFYDGAASAGVKVKGLLSDVESFAQTLRMMKETLEQENVQSSLHSTGHIGNHWTNLSISIQDGQHTLVQLQSSLDKVNKSVGILDGARKHLRLQGATQEITMFQQQVRSYRDTIQLSLQTVILWNQVTLKESTDKILPNLDELHDSIRRIAIELNNRMTTLQTLVESKTKDEHIQSLSNLRKCVQSAASVVSSASTTLGVESTDLASYSSEFGDCFPKEPSEPMLRWISSDSINGSEEGHPVVSTSRRHRNAYSKSMPQLDETSVIDGFDSDEDLEIEMVQSLLRRGRKKLDVKDFAGAEHLFRNCLLRTTSNGSVASPHQTPKSEIMMLLFQTYRQQKKWTEAQALLSEKIAMGSRKSDAGEVLSDMLLLVEVLQEKRAYAEALLYGRQALKGYRRLGESGNQGVGESLRHLVKICHEDGNVDEEEAYAAILADYMDQQPSILHQVASSSKPIKSWHDVEYTSISELVTSSSAPIQDGIHQTTTSSIPTPPQAWR